MTTASIHQPAVSVPGRGATALGTAVAGDAVRHPRHLFGNAVRAVRVFAGTAFSVAVLGQYDGRPAADPLVRTRSAHPAA
ncbi:hypothetical protein [Streptomyces sp. NPDC054784]